MYIHISTLCFLKDSVKNMFLGSISSFIMESFIFLFNNKSSYEANPTSFYKLEAFKYNFLTFMRYLKMYLIKNLLAL